MNNRRPLLLAVSFGLVLLSVTGCSEGSSGNVCSANVVAAGVYEFATRADWRQAMADSDAASEAYMKGGDYVLVTDARTRTNAMTTTFIHAQHDWVDATHATTGCADVVAAHDALKTAHELVEHDSAGADAKLATAQANWAALTK